jgi:hypothetical protein
MRLSLALLRESDDVPDELDLFWSSRQSAQFIPFVQELVNLQPIEGCVSITVDETK